MRAPVTTLVNGVPEERVAVAERALQYGDGLFETISCVGGRPRWLDLHLQRLRLGCERLRLPFQDYGSLAREIAALAATEQAAAEQAAGEPRCLVKVIVSRGVALRRGYAPSGAEQPTRIVSRYEWPLESSPAAALRVCVSEVRLGINPRLAGLKHLNRLEQVLAQLARPAGVDEVLMLSSSAEVIGGSMTNVFFADDTGLFTPQLEECGVAGVMRRRVLQAAGALRHPEGSAVGDPRAPMGVTVRRVMATELAGVREAFVTNVRWGIRSIGSLDGRALAGDDYAQQLRRRIDAAQS